MDIVLCFYLRSENGGAEMFASSIFVKNDYRKSNRALQSWDKSLIIDFRHWKNITRANMKEFADDQLRWTKIYIDKMNESFTMFPVKVTLNKLPDQVFVSVPFVSISTPFFDIMNFIETPYHFECCLSLLVLQYTTTS